jgi:hypothetical protein
MRDGMVMFFLHVLFEKGHTIKMRMEITKLLKTMIDEVQSVVGAFLPIHFFLMTEHAKDPTSTDDELVETFLHNIDA